MDQFRDDVHREQATPPNPRQAVEARRHEIDNLVRDVARHQEAAELARDLAAADDSTGEP